MNNIFRSEFILIHKSLFSPRLDSISPPITTKSSPTSPSTLVHPSPIRPVPSHPPLGSPPAGSGVGVPPPSVLPPGLFPGLYGTPAGEKILCFIRMRNMIVRTVRYVCLISSWLSQDLLHYMKAS